jgi:hypothetical protein
MHRLPPDLDLSFFKDKPLLQVCIGANELILHFDDDVSITVTSRIAVRGPLERQDTYEDFSKAAPAVLSLLNDVVTMAEGDAAGTLALAFRSGICLEFHDTSDHYESYLVRHSDKTIVV